MCRVWQPDDCVAGTEDTAVAVVRMSAAAGTEAMAGQTAAAMAVAAGTAATVSWRRWRSGDECARRSGCDRGVSMIFFVVSCESLGWPGGCSIVLGG